MKFTKIAPKEDWIIVSIGDTSFKSEEKAAGRFFQFLSNSRMIKAAPIYWKAKTIDRVFYSSKDAEILNVSRMVEDTMFAARQVEILLFGDLKKHVKVIFFIDLEATLESIASSKQIDWKTIKLMVGDLKDRLVDRDIYFYAGLPTENM